jgi:hypothetical protein
MRTLLGCATALLLSAGGAWADELDRDTKGKPAGTPAAVKTAVVSGSELDKESPEQSHHYHWRGGYGHGGYRSYGYGGYGGYSSFYRPSYGIGVYSSYYTPAFYPTYSYPAYYGGFGYGSFYRPYVLGAGVSFRF